MRRFAATTRASRSVVMAAPVIFTAHALEEYLTGFPEWATRHFGTTSKHFYLASHLVLISAVVATAEAARRRPDRRNFRIALGSIASGFVANGIFHVQTTLRFTEWSPGLASAVLLMIPGGAAIVRDLYRREEADHRDLVITALGGLALNGAAVASLRLDMPTLQRFS